MMTIWRRFMAWWYWRRYGICPDHLTLARSGGGYEPKWICDACDRENRVKHETRISGYIKQRQQALERQRRREAIR